jgi:hypothetical protein
MNFSQVKSIQIPEGEVKQISVNGTTIWKGGVTISVTATNATVTGAGEYDNGSTFTITITADNGYYLLPEEIPSSTTTYVEVDGNSKPKVITYTGTATENKSYTVTPIKYYTFTYNDGNTHTNGNVQFYGGNYKSISGNNQFGTINFSGSLKINFTYYSRLIYNYHSSTCENQGFQADDRIITSYSGATDSTTLSNWIGSGTGYRYVYCSNKTITGDYSFTASSVDSQCAYINSYLTSSEGKLILKNTSANNKTLELPYNADQLVYSGYDDVVKLTIYSKQTGFNYSGEGTVTFGDGSESPKEWKVQRTVKSYKLSVSKGTGVSSVNVYRGSSPNGNITGPVSNGATIYYGDTLTVSASADSYYKMDSYTSSYTVTGNVSVSVTASFDNNPNIYVDHYSSTSIWTRKVYFKNDSPYSITITQIVSKGDKVSDINVTVSPNSISDSITMNINKSSDTVSQITWYYTGRGSSYSYVKTF